VTPAERWLAALWPLVRARIPAPPARVLEIGCGTLGGFVPMLRSSGYEALGVDPAAPDEPGYFRVEFEHLDLSERLDAVVACTSLHHVTDPAEVLDRATASLASGGGLVVVEWSWEAFDENTAHWCFQRLPPDDDRGWLHRRRDEWAASGQEWGAYVRDWAQGEGLHRGEALLGLSDRRFDCDLLARGPYFFPDLAHTSVSEEQRAIDAGQIRANRIDYVGTPRAPL
jgi:SAM-dependent methyltransferase